MNFEDYEPRFDCVKHYLPIVLPNISSSPSPNFFSSSKLYFLSHCEVQVGPSQNRGYIHTFLWYLTALFHKSYYQ